MDRNGYTLQDRVRWMSHNNMTLTANRGSYSYYNNVFGVNNGCQCCNPYGFDSGYGYDVSTYVIHTDDHNHKPTTAETMENLKAGSAVFREGLLEFIKACRTSNADAATNSASQNAKTSGSELESLKKENEELKKQLDGLLRGDSTEQTKAPQTSPVVNPNSDIDLKSINKNISSLKNGVSKDCDAYKKAVQNGDSNGAASSKASLNQDLTKIANYEKELAKLDESKLSDEDKKLVDATKKDINALKNSINNALKTQAPNNSSATENTSANNKTENVNGKKVKETINGETKEYTYVGISQAKANAAAAQKTFLGGKTVANQRSAIIAYNHWATEVLDPASKATPAEVDDCLNIFENYLCKKGANESEYVQDVMATAKSNLSKLKEMQNNNYKSVLGS